MNDPLASSEVLPSKVRSVAVSALGIPVLAGLVAALTQLIPVTVTAQTPSRGTVFRQRGVDPVAPAAPLPQNRSGNKANPYALKVTAVRALDGSNSAGTAGQGAANSALLRKAPASYPGDGSGTDILTDPDRANPRTISNEIVAQGASLLPNNRKMTDFVWAWGQFVDHDLDLTGTSPASGTADISIDDPNDPLGPNPIPFDRSNFQAGTGTPGQPRQHPNQITSFLDASNVYGSSNGRAQALRTMQGGKLNTSAGDLLPFNVNGIDNAGGTSATLFLAGDVRSNENVMLSSLHTLFVREHNRLVTMLALLDPQANDETLYQLARKIVTAEQQTVTYHEWLPALMGPAAPKAEQLKFNQHVNPGVTTEFSTALFRVGHTLLSANLPLSVDGTVTGGVALQTAFFNPSFLTGNPANVDQLLEGFARELSQEIDNKIVDDVRDFLFGPPGAGGLDLASLNIQRGRDHGLPDYNTVRAAFGLSKVASFAQISSNTATQTALQDLYGNVDNIDAWVGALAEDHVPGSSVGPLIFAGLLDQFSRAVLGDKFFFLNDADLNQPAVKAVIDLGSVKFADIVRANTTVSDMQNNPFRLDPAVKSDVVLAFNAKDNRLHLTGNRRDNSVMLISTPIGQLIVGLNGTLINGFSFQLVNAKSKPNLQVDLGAGDDTMIVVAGHFGDGLVVMGDGTDTFTNFLSTFSQLISDSP